MNRTYFAEGEDSDEDRVTYDDEVRTVNSESNWRGNKSKPQSTEGVKYRPLFQYRRFKGDVSAFVPYFIVLI